MSTMPEFGLMGTGEALRYGPTRNPWNTQHGSGGSSSGAAVAVALCMTPLATASDGGGSIRIPASHCGIIGFKPSRNWNLRARAASLIDDFLTSDSLIARSMRDTIWAARFLRTQPPAPVDLNRRLRIALCLEGLDGQHPDKQVADVINKAAGLCETLGHSVTPTDLPLDLEELGRAFEVLWCYGAGEVVDLSRAKLGGDAEALLEPWTLGLAAKRDTMTPNILADAIAAIGAINSQLEQFWSKHDVVLSPVASSTAPRLGVLAPDRDFEDLYRDHFRHVNYTQLQNMAGLPAISLPLFMAADGLPAGAMFWGQYGADDLLLTLGAALEHARPWSARLSPLVSA
jgi:amidase